MTEDGEVRIMAADGDESVAKPNQPVAIIPNIKFNAYYSNATVDRGVLYLANRQQLIAIEDPEAGNRLQKLLGK